jgi:hypothetical protein
MFKSASQALVAAFKIHRLQGRHIVEASDEEMSRIEAEMKTLDRQVIDGLNALSSLGGETQKATVDEAQAAYAEFEHIGEKILELSRRNSDVQSFAVSLGEKRKATAMCRDRLNALQESIQSYRFTATR